MNDEMKNHLLSRHLNPDNYHVYYDNEVATFLLFNLSGEIVGYQNYRPDAPKTKSNDFEKGRYYTYRSKVTDFPHNMTCKKIACWGLETYHYSDILFLTEGIFDACRIHSYGFAAIALLANDPKEFKQFLFSTGKLCIAICDNDSSGIKLAKLGHLSFTTTKKDLGEMEQIEFETFMNKILENVSNYHE